MRNVPAPAGPPAGAMPVRLPFAVCLFFLAAFLLAYPAGSPAVECFYVPAPSPGNEYPELASSSDCGKLADPDTLIVDDALLKKLRFDGKGLAAILFRKAVFYVGKNGATAPTVYFDNGPDYFAEGLARTTRKGKIGFMDEKLDTIIEPAYDFAWPFSGGLAVVCNGCRKTAEGEHAGMTGGVWGKIDRRGKIIVPLRPVESR